MIITDLDGTLLTRERTVSNNDINTLVDLGKLNIPRIIATGRSVLSAKRVLSDNFPIDFLIFSSGAGIMDWHSKCLLYQKCIPAEPVTQIIQLLSQHKLSFMVHEPIPLNHRFAFCSCNNGNDDFERRIQIYKEFSYSLNTDGKRFGPACQFLIIINEQVLLSNRLFTSLADMKLIRTTSPLDGKSFWLEIFPHDVSKACAAEWLRRRLGYTHSKTFALGNDYNDLDLLDWANFSYVVKNAVQDLKYKYKIISDHNSNGFSEAVIDYLKQTR